MNFGRRNISKEIDSLSPKGRWVCNKIKGIVMLVVAVAAVFFVWQSAKAIYEDIMGVLDDAPEMTIVDAAPSGYISTIYNSVGEETTELVDSGSNRIYVTLEDVPLNLQHAFVAIEDERFYEHNGIDMQGIVRAGITGLTTGSFTEGASTITQQLLKNNVFDNWTDETTEDRVERKMQEQYLAVQLEKQVSKDWVMENYLNTINLGQNTLGVQAASQRYFGKDVSELTLSECACLAAITQNPSQYNPISHPTENNERREKVLGYMLEQGYITNAEYEEAVADDVYSRIKETNLVYESEPANITSYFDDALTKQVLRDLQDLLGYSESQAYNTLYGGGIEIYSTQDPEMQAICDETINDDSLYDVPETISFSYALSVEYDDGSITNYSEQTMFTWLRDNKDRTTLNYSSQEAAEEDINEYREWVLSEYGGTVLGENVTFTPEPQASMTLMEQSTGMVRALVGGRGEKSASMTLNRASDTTMQPGSTFKIITTYAPALEVGIVSLGTSLVDEEITYADGKVIKNADGVYRGPTTVREAITNSINVIAILTSREVTLDTCYEYAQNFGISTLTDQDIVEALPLGGITDGVTNMELTATYAAIANGGVYNEPILYTRIVDHDGNVLLDRTPESHRVISEDTAWLLTSAMEDVVTEGTGTMTSFPGMSIAGKTGTTSSSRASWFVGYTPYYTCGVWGGYDDNTELSSTQFTKNLWREAMTKLHEGLEDPGFIQPAGIVEVSVCTETGLLAGSSCPYARREYFSSANMPTDYCSHYYVPQTTTESSGGESSSSSEGSTDTGGGESNAEGGEDSGNFWDQITDWLGGDTGGGEDTSGGDTGGGDTGAAGGEATDGGGDTGGGDIGGEGNPE